MKHIQKETLHAAKVYLTHSDLFDKEIEILDENNIKLTVQINEEGGTNVDFILPKEGNGVNVQFTGRQRPCRKDPPGH